MYTDDLSKCLVQSTTSDDRALLVKWMFSAASAHPAVKTISAVTPEQTEDINRQTGQLFTNLLADACMQKTKQATINEGQTAIRDSYQNHMYLL